MSSQPVGFSKPEDRSISNSTSWQLEAGKDVERNEKSRYATSNYSSFIDPDEDNQSAANKWFIRKLCIYDRFFHVQTLERSWHLYLAWHTHTPPPSFRTSAEGSAHDRNKRRHTMRKVVTVFVTLGSETSKVLWTSVLYNLTFPMFLSPLIERIRQNKKQSMFIHVKTATRYRRGFTVISSLSITSTLKLKLLILSHDVIFMIKYRNHLEIYYYCTTPPETNISDVDSFLLLHIIGPWQLCKVYMPVFTYWAEKTGKELHFISSASLQ